MSTLQQAQACFTEWLHEVDAVLIESQREHENAITAFKNGDTNAFADSLGRMAGRVDEARAMFQTAFDAGFEKP